MMSTFLGERTSLHDKTTKYELRDNYKGFRKGQIIQHIEGSNYGSIDNQTETISILEIKANNYFFKSLGGAVSRKKRHIKNMTKSERLGLLRRTGKGAVS